MSILGKRTCEVGEEGVSRKRMKKEENSKNENETNEKKMKIKKEEPEEMKKDNLFKHKKDVLTRKIIQIAKLTRCEAFIALRNRENEVYFCTTNGYFVEDDTKSLVMDILATDSEESGFSNDAHDTLVQPSSFENESQLLSQEDMKKMIEKRSSVPILLPPLFLESFALSKSIPFDVFVDKEIEKSSPIDIPQF